MRWSARGRLSTVANPRLTIIYGVPVVICVNPKQNKKWTNREDETLRSYFGKISRQALADLLPNRSLNGISYRARTIGCKPYDYAIRGKLNRGKHRRYSIDLSFFDRPNLLNCYWAGFIAADGCIKSERSEVVIVLQARDKQHLENFREACNFTGPIKTLQPKNSSPINGRSIKSGPAVRLEFYGVHQWINSLEQNFKIAKRKSLTLEPPNLDDKLAMAFITGYLDGDGCIGYNKCTRQYSMRFRGTKNMLEWIKANFDKLVPAINRRAAKVGKWDGHFSYVVSGSRALVVIKKLGQLPLQKLVRKWTKII